MRVAACFEAAEFERFLEAKLTTQEIDEISAHLESCDQCTRMVRSLPEAALVGMIRAARKVPGPSAEKQETRDLIQRVLALRASGWTASEVRDAKGTGHDAGPSLTNTPPPAPIGRYRIMGQLGSGGMGTVYSAEDPELHRRVAIKVPQFNGSPDHLAHMRERFLREARAAAAVDHPNVCRIYDVGEQDGVPFVVMALIEGQSLGDWLEQHNHLDDRQAVALTIRVAEALQAVHDHGIVHRDLKPANILLRKDGSPVLTDFGLAQMREDGKQLTAAGMLLGTPAFMAPEQVLPQMGTVSPRSDLYSLGVVLFRLLTGRLPAEGSIMEILFQVGRNQAPAPSRFRPDLDPVLDGLVHKALARNPEERYPSVHTFAEALKNWLRNEAASATAGKHAAAPSADLRGRGPMRRRWRIAAGVVGLIAASVVAGAIIVHIKHPDGKQTDLVAPEGSRIEVDAKGGVSVTLPGDNKNQEEAEVAQAARQRLATYCYRCHGEQGSVEGGFNYVLDRDQLVAHKKIAPGQADKSPLLRRIVEKEMPPADEKPRPSDEDVAVLQRWIKAGAPAFAPTTAQAPFVPVARIMEVIRDDLEKQPERSRRFLRYFTLTHLHNAGLSQDELQTYRNGISKLLNSLSWNKAVVVPSAIDVEKTVLRIDLRDYDWHEREWEALIEQYPYGVTDGSGADKHCIEATGCSVPLVRGDWFVAMASRPPLYHDLLQLPRSDAELEKLLHVKAAENIQAERVVRAGFNNSGISRNNRLIERHETPNGAYWKSYDFKENTGPQNLFERPLGPGDDERSFRHAGGEIIFNLPNGLQAYMLVNAQGSRIDKAPTDIVSDSKRPDRAVENGLSCMACHSRGIIAKDDQVRAHVEKNRGAFSKEEVGAIMALYAPADKFRELQEKDTERFQKAAAATGARVGKTEPILALAQQYEAPLSPRRAAAEVGLRPDEFLSRLEKSDPLQRTVGTLQLPEGTVPREVFATAYMDMTTQWKLGTAAAITALSDRADDGPPEIPAPRLERNRVDVKLPEPFAGVVTGGGGRYLIFHLKKAKKLAIFDVSEVRIIHEIDLPNDDVRIAAGREKLFVVVPGQRLLQRWDLRTGKRERSAPIADDRPIAAVLMGSYANGPLMLWIGGQAQLWDADKLEPLAVKGEMLGHDPHWSFDVRVSADGKTFVSWHNTITGQFFYVMRLQGNEVARLRSPDGHSVMGFWTMPNADGTLFTRYDQKFYSGDMKVIAGDGFGDSVQVPTEDPRFFLALRRKAQDNVTICTTADRRPVYTFKKLEEFPTSPANSGTNRVRYIPAANILVTLPPGDDRVIIRRFNLLEALDQSGTDYLVVLSNPKSHAQAGTVYAYPIMARSKAGGLRYTLDAGPAGMSIMPSGVVRWQVPEQQEGQSYQVIVTIKDAKGKEIQHAFEFKVVPPAPVPPVKTRPPKSGPDTRITPTVDPKPAEREKPEQRDTQAPITMRATPLEMKFVRLSKGTYFAGGGGGKAGKKTEIKSDFEIANQSVTQAQWQELMGDNPSFFSRKGGGSAKVKDITDDDLKQFPVEQVSWNDVQAFIKKLNEKERGKRWTFRLPTAAEWEYACRGGAHSEAECSFDFYFDKPTNTATPAQANCNQFVGRTTRVGSYKPNSLGLYDMHGNVNQWCEDVANLGKANRVLRGGSWNDSLAFARACMAHQGPQTRGNNGLGFRLVRLPANDGSVKQDEKPPPTKTDAGPAPARLVLSLANFEKIKDGMAIKEVEMLLGGPGKEETRNKLKSITWTDIEGGVRVISVIVMDGKVIAKSQVGLK